MVGRGGQAEFLGGQPADAFAVHGQSGGAGGRDHFGQPGCFDLDQHVGGDGLDFGHDQLRLFAFHKFAQCNAVGHRNNVGAVSDLMAGCILIAVDGNDFDAQALQRNDHFLAKFAGAEEHDTGGGGGKRGADLHGISSVS